MEEVTLEFNSIAIMDGLCTYILSSAVKLNRIILGSLSALRIGFQPIISRSNP